MSGWYMGCFTPILPFSKLLYVVYILVVNYWLHTSRLHSSKGELTVLIDLNPIVIIHTVDGAGQSCKFVCRRMEGEGTFWFGLFAASKESVFPSSILKGVISVKRVYFNNFLLFYGEMFDIEIYTCIYRWYPDLPGSLYYFLEQKVQLHPVTWYIGNLEVRQLNRSIQNRKITVYPPTASLRFCHWDGHWRPVLFIHVHWRPVSIP